MTSMMMPDVTSEDAGAKQYQGKTLEMVRVDVGRVTFMAQACFPETGGLRLWIKYPVTHGTPPKLGDSITVSYKKEVIANGTLTTSTDEAALRFAADPQAAHYAQASAREKIVEHLSSVACSNAGGSPSLTSKSIALKSMVLGSTWSSRAAPKCATSN